MAIPWLVVVGVGVAIRDSMGCSSFWFCLFEGFCCKEGNRKWCIEVFCPCVFYMSLEVWGNEAAISLPLPEGAWIGGVFSLLGNHTENSILWVWQVHLQGRLRCWSTAGRGLFCLWMVHIREGGLFARDSLLSAFFVNNDIATSISPSQYAVRHPSAYRVSRFPVLAKQTGVSRNCTKDVRCAADIPCLLLICRVINGRILRWRSIDGASVILRKSLHELCSFDIMLPSWTMIYQIMSGSLTSMALDLFAWNGAVEQWSTLGLTCVPEHGSGDSVKWCWMMMPCAVIWIRRLNFCKTMK